MHLLKVLMLADGDGSVFTGSDAGRPMQLDGKIVLCGHSDTTFHRNYNGAISHLSIYDNALNETQVLALFHQVRKKERKEKSTPLGVMTGASVPRSSPRSYLTDAITNLVTTFVIR